MFEYDIEFLILGVIVSVIGCGFVSISESYYGMNFVGIGFIVGGVTCILLGINRKDNVSSKKDTQEDNTTNGVTKP